MFHELFQPIRIGGMELKNRLVVPPMGTNLANRDGTCGDALAAYYTERAKGGFAMVTVECTAVSPDGTSLLNECRMYEKAHAESFRKLTEGVHLAGGKACIQLVHHGREGSSAYNGGVQVAAPSKLPCPLMQEIPHALTTEEVYEYIDKFVNAAALSKEAGFDAVELHAASGYLIEQFLSSHSNKRIDEFGGPLHNRMKFLLFIIEGIKKKLGESYPVLVRICADEYMTGGITIEEAKAICRAAEKAGADAIDVTVGTYGSIQNVIGSAYMAPGYQLGDTKRIKNCVNVPVIGVGRLCDPYIAREALLDGSLDIVAVGRQSIADPYFPNKLMSGEIEEISPCISCNQGCIHQLFADRHISCVCNPFSGFEADKRIDKTETPKRVLIAGAGPGGLEAAWLLAKKGHAVSLYERSGSLGGAFLTAAYPPGKSDITKMLQYYVHQCKKYNVDIHTNTEVTKELFEREKPDAVVLATGSVPLTPPIKGIGNEALMKADDVIMSNAVPGYKVLVAGGGLIGAETADFLAEQRRCVTMIEMKHLIAEDTPAHTRPVLMQLLKEKNVAIYTDAVIREFFDDGVEYEQDGEIKTLRGFDTVVLAMGTRAYNPLEEIAKNVCGEVYVIGDAKKAGNVYAATHDAMEAAAKI